MKKPDLRNSTKEIRLEVRRRAVFAVLNSRDRSISKVAKEFQVRWHTLNHWVNLYKTGGEKALAKDERGAEKWANTKLTEKETIWTQKAITNKMPDQYQLPFMLWTRKAIQDLIERKINKKISLSTISNLLKNWGMSSQKPKLRAYQQQPERIQKWIDTEYPIHQKRAKKEKAVIHWCDETTISSRDLVGKGFSKIGQTPILKASGSRFSVNMISTITNRGDVRFMLFKDTMNAIKFIDFLRRLIKGENQKIYLIVDNIRVHHAKKVQAWELKNQDKIKLIYLPPYAPEHNPDEYLNQTLKARLKRKPKDKDAVSLRKSVYTEMKTLQKSPKVISALFEAPLVKYAA
jgi:transposase